MTKTYLITGMKCDGCVANVKEGLMQTEHVLSAEVDLSANTAIITMDKEIDLPILQAAIGAYVITPAVA